MNPQNYDTFLSNAVMLGFIVWLAEAVLKRLNITNTMLAAIIDFVLKIVSIIFLVIVVVAVTLFVWSLMLTVARGL